MASVYKKLTEIRKDEYYRVSYLQLIHPNTALRLTNAVYQANLDTNIGTTLRVSKPSPFVRAIYDNLQNSLYD